MKQINREEGSLRPLYDVAVVVDLIALDGVIPVDNDAAEMVVGNGGIFGKAERRLSSDSRLHKAEVPEMSYVGNIRRCIILCVHREVIEHRMLNVGHITIQRVRVTRVNTACRQAGSNNAILGEKARRAVRAFVRAILNVVLDIDACRLVNRIQRNVDRTLCFISVLCLIVRAEGDVISLSACKNNLCLNLVFMHTCTRNVTRRILPISADASCRKLNRHIKLRIGASLEAFGQIRAVFPRRRAVRKGIEMHGIVKCGSHRRILLAKVEGEIKLIVVYERERRDCHLICDTDLLRLVSGGRAEIADVLPHAARITILRGHFIAEGCIIAGLVKIPHRINGCGFDREFNTDIFRQNIACYNVLFYQCRQHPRSLFAGCIGYAVVSRAVHERIQSTHLITAVDVKSAVSRRVLTALKQSRHIGCEENRSRFLSVQLQGLIEAFFKLGQLTRCILVQKCRLRRIENLLRIGVILLLNAPASPSSNRSDRRTDKEERQRNNHHQLDHRYTTTISKCRSTVRADMFHFTVLFHSDSPSRRFCILTAVRREPPAP